MAWASCVVVPLDDDKIPHAFREAVAYEMAFEAGHDEVPHSPSGQPISESASICFETFDPSSLLSQATMSKRFWNDERDRMDRDRRMSDALQEARDLTRQLDADDARWEMLNVPERLDALKRLLRLSVLRNRLGIR